MIWLVLEPQRATAWVAQGVPDLEYKGIFLIEVRLKGNACFMT